MCSTTNVILIGCTTIAISFCFLGCHGSVSDDERKVKKPSTAIPTPSAEFHEKEMDCPSGTVRKKESTQVGDLTAIYCETIEGRMEGKHYLLFSNGSKCTEANYINGLQEGKRISWYKDGAIMSVSNFLRGKLDGNKKEWYPDGTKRSELVYSGGKLVKSKCWSEKGNEEVCWWDKDDGLVP